MAYQFRPAVREKTPLIIGIAGPTKSGKTYSAHRIAIGLANGGTIVMINAEGPRGHQYADKFKYLACDLTPPFRPTVYTEVLKEAAKLNPAVVIIDSGSHMHDGPGGLLEWHDEIAKRMAKGDPDKIDKMNFPAWADPKAAENEFIYTMLGMTCPIVLCFRAKEKIKLQGGKVIDLGWQPIAGERVAFETIFTLMLPPHSKGVPDLAISEMREPFDTMVPAGKPIDEQLGRELAKWAAGAGGSPIDELTALLVKHGLNAKDADTKKRCSDLFQEVFATRSWAAIAALDAEKLRAGTTTLREKLEPRSPETGEGGGDGDPHAEAAEAVRIARGALTPPLTDEEFDRFCEETAGVKAEALEKADPAALDDLLKLLRGYTTGDAVATKTVDKARTVAA